MAVVLNAALMLSLFTTPVSEPLNSGFDSPYGRLVLLAVTVSGAFRMAMSKVSFVLNGGVPLSVAVTLTEYVPELVGVPLKVRVGPLNEMPGGRLLAVNDNVWSASGSVKAFVANVKLNAPP